MKDTSAIKRSRKNSRYVHSRLNAQDYHHNPIQFKMRNKYLGWGYYGRVKKGYYTDPSTKKIKSCAIKVIGAYRYDKLQARQNNLNYKFLAINRAEPETQSFKQELTLLQRRGLLLGYTSRRLAHEQVFNTAKHSAYHPSEKIINTKIYIAMKFVPGVNLRTWLNNHHSANPNVLVSILLKLVHAVQRVHRQGIIHCDIKPSNFKVTIENNKCTRATLLDFGLSQFKPKCGFFMQNNILGTEFYVAPEVEDHTLSLYSFSSDIYSLGKTFIEMCSYYNISDPQNTLHELVAKMLHRIPKCRIKLDEIPSWLHAYQDNLSHPNQSSRHKRHGSI